MISDDKIKEFCEKYRINYESFTAACSKKISDGNIDISIPTNLGEVLDALKSTLIGLLLVEERYSDSSPASIELSQDHIVMVYRMLKTFHEGKSYTTLEVI